MVIGKHPSCSGYCDAPSPGPAPRRGRAGGTGRSATPTRNIATGMGDEVSRTVSERTCRGNTRSRGKRKRGKESKSTTTAVNIYIYATDRKGNSHSLATKAVKRAHNSPSQQHRGK